MATVLSSLMARYSKQPQQPNGSQPQGNGGQPNNPQQPQQGNPQGQPGNAAKGGGPGTPANGMGNNLSQQGGPNATQQQETNPLDGFTGIWDNTPAAQKEEAPSFNIPSETLDKVVSGSDFLKGIAPEAMQKLKSGDFSGFEEVMQAGLRNVYRQSIEHGAHLTGGFVGARDAFNEKKLPSFVRDELTSNELQSSTISNGSHPVVQGQLRDIAARLRKQFPDASPSEIKQASMEYLQELSNALNPKPSAPSSKEAAGFDWGESGDSFFSEEGSTNKQLQ